MDMGRMLHSAGRGAGRLASWALATVLLGILRGSEFGLALGFASCQGSAEQAPDMGSACWDLSTGRCLDKTLLPSKR